MKNKFLSIALILALLCTVIPFASVSVYAESDSSAYSKQLMKSLDSLGEDVSIKQVETGPKNTYVLLESGSVYACGYNGYGQLGNTTFTTSAKLVKMIMPTGKKGSAISAGENHIVVLMTDGSVYACGNNGADQLGIGTTQSSYKTYLTAMKLPTGKKAAAVSAGSNYTLVLMTDGSVYACGYNSYGQFGNGTLSNNFLSNPKLTSMNLPTGKKAAAVSAGSNYTVVLMTDGSIYACGDNYYGQFGNGTREERMGIPNLMAMKLPAGKKAMTVSAGERHTLVLMTDGSVYACGDNFYGQLGNGTELISSMLVQTVMPAGKKAAAVSARNDHTVVLMTDGSVYACGGNEYGQLGNDTASEWYEAHTNLTEISLPTGKKAVAVSAGWLYTVILMSDGSVYSCGDNYNGQLGNGELGKSSILEPTTLPTEKKAASVSAGDGHTVVLMTDGSVYACGDNSSGQVGNGIVGGTYPNFTAMDLPTGKKAAAVSAGSNQTVVLMTDGSVYACGNNNYGQLGSNVTEGNFIGVSHLTAMVLPTGKKAAAVSAGKDYTAVLMTDGSVYFCGNNYYGQFGNGTLSEDYDSIPNLMAMKLPTGKKAAAISVGRNHTVVLMTDNTVYACGDNIYGQLGNNVADDEDGHIPNLLAIKLPTGKKAAAVSAGVDHTLVLMTDGSVYACGDNLNGQLGDGTESGSYKLVQTKIPSGKKAVAISAGMFFNEILMNDGSVYACGDNSYGQLGIDKILGFDLSIYTLLGVNLPSGKKAMAVSAGLKHTLVIMTDGSVYACGDNSFSQLGNGKRPYSPSLVPMILSILTEPPQVLYGDANEDGKVTVLDLLTIKKDMVKIVVNINRTNADVNFDETCNLTDMLMIKKHMVGIKLAPWDLS